MLQFVVKNTTYASHNSSAMHETESLLQLDIIIQQSDLFARLESW